MVRPLSDFVVNDVIVIDPLDVVGVELKVVTVELDKLPWGEFAPPG